MRVAYSVLAVAVLSVPTLLPAADLTRTLGGTSYTFKDVTYMGVPGRLYVPSGYDGSMSYEMVTFFHGVGEAVSNGVDGQINGNIANLIKRAETDQFFVFAPQFGNGWMSDHEQASVTRAIGQIALDYNINPGKIYATGLSAGGSDTMIALRTNTTMFAAFVPLSVAQNHFTSPADAAVGVGRPTWYYTGFNDGTQYRDMTRQSYINQLQAAGYAGVNLPTYPTTATNYTHSSPDGLYHFTEYATGGHNNVVWNNGAYNDSEMYSWLHAQANTFAKPDKMSFAFNNPDSAIGSSIIMSGGRAVNAVGGWTKGGWSYNTAAVINTFALNEDGTRTTVIVELINGFDWASTTAVPAGAPFDSSVAGTYWAFSAEAQIIFHGLEANSPYNIDLFGTGAVGGTGIFTANGVSAEVDPRNNNISLVTLENVFSDSWGKVTLDIAPGSGWSGINALTITAVPEPASLGLLGVAGILALRRRTQA